MNQSSLETLERPKILRHFDNLHEHLGDLSKIFNGRLVYPRQLEIQLPGDGRNQCNLKCYYCQGRFLDHSLFSYEKKALKLLDELEGRIRYVIYGGTYTEPLLNPYLEDFIWRTKQHGSIFGLHTNGSLLEKLEDEQDFITNMCKISTANDYISVSLDAGSRESHMKIKRADCFDSIIRGLRRFTKLKDGRNNPCVKVNYLLNRYNSSEREIAGIVELMKDIKVDMLRFSIPYDAFGKDFGKVAEYKTSVELPEGLAYEKKLEQFISKKPEKPFVFYMPPETQDIENMNFEKCINGYYEIAVGADGGVYKCCSTTSPTFFANRIGPVPDNLEEFDALILANQNPYFNPLSCFRAGARCTRTALEINSKWKEGLLCQESLRN